MNFQEFELMITMFFIGGSSVYVYDKDNLLYRIYASIPLDIKRVISSGDKFYALGGELHEFSIEPFSLIGNYGTSNEAWYNKDFVVDDEFIYYPSGSVIKKINKTTMLITITSPALGYVDIEKMIDAGEYLIILVKNEMNQLSVRVLLKSTLETVANSISPF